MGDSRKAMLEQMQRDRTARNSQLSSRARAGETALKRAGLSEPLRTEEPPRKKSKGKELAVDVDPTATAVLSLPSPAADPTVVAERKKRQTVILDRPPSSRMESPRGVSGGRSASSRSGGERPRSSRPGGSSERRGAAGTASAPASRSSSGAASMGLPGPPRPVPYGAGLPSLEDLMDRYSHQYRSADEMTVRRLYEAGGTSGGGAFTGSINIPATAHPWHDGATARQLLTGTVMPPVGLSLMTESLPDFTSHGYKALASNLSFGVAALQRLEDVGYLLDLARQDAIAARKRAAEGEQRAAAMDENNRLLSERVGELERELRDSEAERKSLFDRAARAEKEKTRLTRSRDDSRAAAKDAEAKHLADRESLVAAHQAELAAREEAHAEQLGRARAEGVAEYKASPALRRGVLRSSVVQYKNGFQLAVTRIRRADPSVEFNDDFAAFDEADASAPCEAPPPFDDRSEGEIAAEEVAAEATVEEEAEEDASMPAIDLDPEAVQEVLGSLQIDLPTVKEVPAPAEEPEVQEEGEVAPVEDPAGEHRDEPVVVE